MTRRDDGGAAFPCHTDQIIVDPKGERMIPVLNGGMSLRQWYAGQAMAGMCACPHRDGSHEAYANDAFAFADALLAHKSEAAPAKLTDLEALNRLADRCFELRDASVKQANYQVAAAARDIGCAIKMAIDRPKDAAVPPSPGLDALIEDARTHVMTDAEKAAQRENFAAANVALDRDTTPSPAASREAAIEAVIAAGERMYRNAECQMPTHSEREMLEAWRKAVASALGPAQHGKEV